jgi:hypothetical protein
VNRREPLLAVDARPRLCAIVKRIHRYAPVRGSRAGPHAIHVARTKDNRRDVKLRYIESIMPICFDSGHMTSAHRLHSASSEVLLRVNKREMVYWQKYSIGADTFCNEVCTKVQPFLGVGRGLVVGAGLTGDRVVGKKQVSHFLCAMQLDR